MTDVFNIFLWNADVGKAVDHHLMLWYPLEIGDYHPDPDNANANPKT